uniref:hypothetical protein n=1 Tax=uncultured Microscilla sp. TaxID=432653 RepID=UPI0026081EAE
SKALGNRPVYATDALVRVHADGGITTIARSGSKTSKWRTLQNGNDVGRAPKPKKPGKEAKKEFVEMGWPFKKKKAPVPEKIAITQLDKANIQKLKTLLENNNYKVVEAKKFTSDEWKELIKLLEGDAKKLNELINVTPFEEVKELSKLLKWNRVYKPDVYQSVS